MRFRVCLIFCFILLNERIVLKAEGSNDLNAVLICYHNDREGISYDDIIEHIGNAEYGSAWRDAKEKEEIQEMIADITDVAKSVLETIGKEALRGQDD